MNLIYRKKSNESKSNFYLNPYKCSVSHEPPKSEQNMDQSRSQSHSNLSDINSSDIKASGHSHNGTWSRFTKLIWKNQKKPSQSSSVQNISKVDNKEFKHLISTPEQPFNIPQIKTPTLSNFTLDPETREEQRKKLSQLSDQERIELQQKGLELLKAQFNGKLQEKQNIEKVINEIRNHLTTKRQQFRSYKDLEKIRSEIRNLTNEKGELELIIFQKMNWKCLECTFINASNRSHCEMCNKERQLNEFISCKFCSHKNSLSSMSCINCSSELLDNNEESHRTRQYSNSSLCSTVRLNGANTNGQNGMRIPAYAQGQANYTSQSSSSSNISVFSENPVYFNLSNSNLNEIADARIPPRSPHVTLNHLQNPSQQRPSIPVILDDNSKCKFKKKFF